VSGSGSIYLDWAATSPPDPDVLREVEETAVRQYGNPSSPHPEGLEAHECLERKRSELAQSLGCGREELYFTSGGTESNNLALSSVLSARLEGRGRPPAVVLSGVEHPSLFAPAARFRTFGIPVTFVPAGADGAVDPARVAEELTPDTRLVSVMALNNETGAVQPVEEIARSVRDFAARTGRRIHFHTDAVQAFGKIEMDLAGLGVDSASLSAHKIRGPRGIGALFLSRKARLNPLVLGGEQERTVRPGTENLPGIAGFSVAARKAVEGLEQRLEKARNIMSRLIRELSRIQGAVILPQERIEHPQAYSPYILAAAFPPIPGEVLVRVLGERGICVSTGSACSSSKKDRDRVLRNMGISAATAFSAIRISTGGATTDEHCARLIESLRAEVPPLMKIAR